MRSTSLVFLTSVLALAEAQTRVSTTGRCGSGFRLTCAGSTFGSCCSKNNWCGMTPDHCGSGCQTGWGTCGSGPPSTPEVPSTKPVSKDARCGAAFGGQTCQGSAFGNCCSQYGYCGSSNAYCEVDTCQKNFGTCNGGGAPPSGPITLSSAVVSSDTANSPVRTVTEYVTRSDVITTTITILGEGEVITVTEPTTVVSQTTSTLSLPGEFETTTVTIAGDAETTTLTVPGEGEVITVTEPTTLPAETQTSVVTTTLPVEVTTVTLPGEAETTTVTVPGDAEIITVTEPTTLPAEIQTSFVTTTLPAEITTVTVPGEAETTTVTEPTTLPGETQTSVVTTTLPAETEVTTTTIPASTVTVTASAAPTCATEVVQNGSFEAALTTTWTPLANSPDLIERVLLGSGSAAEGAYAIRARSSGTNSNLPVHLQQAVSLCAGGRYRVSWKQRRVTTAGTIMVQVFLQNTLLQSVTATSSTWVTSTSGEFTIPAEYTSSILRFAFTFTGGAGSAKEVMVDDVRITKLD